MHLKCDGSLVTPPELRGPTKSHQEAIDFHCWDMGGQEDYWSTHQIFFTPDALYVLAYHGREDIGRGRVREWLTLIRNRATSRARVILVATHCTAASSFTRPDLTSLDADLQSMIVDFVAVDSFEPNGITELRQALVKHALRDDYFKRRLLGGWQKFQTLLAGVQKPYAQVGELFKTGRSQKISRKNLRELLQLGNDVGLLLWHHQTKELDRYVVLHPDWLSQAIAYVLKSRSVQRANGIVSHSELSKLWAAPPYPDSKPYPKSVHPMLVSLMEENEISYRLPRPEGRGPERSLIAQLVAGAPTAEGRGRWDENPTGAHTEMVRLFSFVPPQGRKPQRLTGLIYRLIVRLHDYSLGREDYKRSVHWQTGVLLMNRFGDRARIEFRDDDELEIRVKGLIPLSFMDRLHDTLREVVDTFWKGVVVREMAMCGEHCPSGIKTGAFDVEMCREDLRDGDTTKRCEVVECRKKVSLQSLLMPPPVPAMVAELRGLLLQRFSSLDEQLDKVQQTLLGMGAQMSAFQQLVREDIRAVMTNMMDDGHAGPRLFSVSLLEPGFWDNPKWATTKIQVTLWCEHSHLPLTFLGKKDPKVGVYQLEVPREWLSKAGKWLKFGARLVLFAKTLGLAAAVPAAMGIPPISPAELKKLTDDAEALQKFTESLKPEVTIHSLSPAEFDSMLRLSPKGQLELAPSFTGFGGRLDIGGGFSRWLRDKIKEKDSAFGEMRKVNDITGKVLWIHPSFLEHYESQTPKMI